MISAGLAYAPGALWKSASLDFSCINSPSAQRLLTDSGEPSRKALRIQAKFWAEVEAVETSARLSGESLAMKRVDESQVREAKVAKPRQGTYP
jgi:hypothetical protein